MNGSIVLTYLTDVLHAVAQGLLAPDIILLLAFIVYALFCIGSVIAERFSERRHFNVVMPKFLAALMEANEDEVPEVIKQSGLLKRQKIALLTVYDYRTLPGDALVALIKRLVDEEETRYDRIIGRNNMAARVSPMLGLMGTLIPLGPGIEALGRADTAALSSSLLIAFDTTVAGLVVAAVCLIVGKIRGNWYGNYMSALDSAMATMLQKIEDMRSEGKIDVVEPTNYAFLYESATGKGSKKAAKTQEDADNANADSAPKNSQDAPAAAVSAAAANAAAALATPAPVTAEPQPQPSYAAEPQPYIADQQPMPVASEPLPSLTAELPAQNATSQTFQSFAAASGASFDPVPMPSFLDSLETAAVDSYAAPTQQYDYAPSPYEQQTISQIPQFGAPIAQAQAAGSYEPAVQGAPANNSIPAFDAGLSFGSPASVDQRPIQGQDASGAAHGWYQPRLRSDADARYGAHPADSGDDGYGLR